MSVKLRKKTISNNRYSFYLDIYHNGKRYYDYLNLYVFAKPATNIEKQINKENTKIAETARAEKEIELNLNTFGYTSRNKTQVDFYTLAADYTDKLLSSSKRQFEACISQLKLFTKEDTLSIKGIDQLFSEDFQKFLKRRFELQTATNYFQKFKTLLNYAVKRKIILSNPAQSVKNSGKKDSIKVYLTIDEIIQLSQTECESPQIKNAFLFACLTGLRHIDIKNLEWQNIKNETIVFKQVKTQQNHQVPLNITALEIIKNQPKITNKVFILPDVSYTNKKLKIWAKTAEITKALTFHVARHSFATNLLIKHNDILTVSRLMGHTSVTHTQTYIKTLEANKKDAVKGLEW